MRTTALQFGKFATDEATDPRRADRLSLRSRYLALARSVELDRRKSTAFARLIERGSIRVADTWRLI